VATTAVTAVYQQVTTGKVNWGQAVGSGLIVGAAIALGPLAAGAVSSVLSGTVGATGASIITGSVIGGLESTAVGAVNGDQGATLLTDTAGGVIGGGLGGYISSVASSFAPDFLNQPMFRRGIFHGLTGAISSVGGNLAGQETSNILNGRPLSNIDIPSVLLSGAVGFFANRWANRTSKPINSRNQTPLPWYNSANFEPTSLEATQIGVVTGSADFLSQAAYGWGKRQSQSAQAYEEINNFREEGTSRRN